jgi:hypothetical protein
VATNPSTSYVICDPHDLWMARIIYRCTRCLSRCELVGGCQIVVDLNVSVGGAGVGFRNSQTMFA